MPKISAGTGPQRNPPPPPGAMPQPPKPPSVAWRIAKFLAVAAVGGIATTYAISKYQKWTRSGDEEGEGMQALPPQQPQFQLPQIVPMPMPYPIHMPQHPPQHQHPFGAYPPPSPKFRSRFADDDEDEDKKTSKRSRSKVDEDLDPSEIYAVERMKLERKLAKVKALEDFDSELKFGEWLDS
jgi:hypothetical protein